ncbi:MAG: PEP-CTERM sorting domain-containing protein [Planctomycetota bacterium]
MQRSLIAGPFAAALLLAAASSAHAQAPISSTFDTDLDGWSALGFDVDVSVIPLGVDFTEVDNTTDMVHSATGGNPGGYAELTDAIEEPSSFASAPAKFRGDLSAYVGGTLSFDYALFDAGTPNSGISPLTVAVFSGDVDDLNALIWIGDAPTPGPDWNSFELAFDTADNGGDFVPVQELQVSELGTLFGFDVPIGGTVGDLLGPATLTPTEILASVDRMILPFEVVDNDGTQNQEDAGLDNVLLTAAAIPEPTSLGMLALGGLMLRRRR